MTLFRRTDRSDGLIRCLVMHHRDMHTPVKRLLLLTYVRDREAHALVTMLPVQVYVVNPSGIVRTCTFASLCTFYSNSPRR